jgi:hypothetical protein
MQTYETGSWSYRLARARYDCRPMEVFVLLNSVDILDYTFCSVEGSRNTGQSQFVLG